MAPRARGRSVALRRRRRPGDCAPRSVPCFAARRAESRVLCFAPSGVSRSQAHRGRGDQSPRRRSRTRSRSRSRRVSAVACVLRRSNAKALVEGLRVCLGGIAHAPRRCCAGSGAASRPGGGGAATAASAHAASGARALCLSPRLDRCALAPPAHRADASPHARRSHSRSRSRSRGRARRSPERGRWGDERDRGLLRGASPHAAPRPAPHERPTDWICPLDGCAPPARLMKRFD